MSACDRRDPAGVALQTHSVDINLGWYSGDSLPTGQSQRLCLGFCCTAKGRRFTFASHYLDSFRFCRLTFIPDQSMGSEDRFGLAICTILELTYTAWDLQPFAQDCGYDGPPFRWDENGASCSAASWTRPTSTSTASPGMTSTTSWIPSPSSGARMKRRTVSTGPSG